MKLPDIHLLRAAILLAEVRNYSRAAKRLGIQQPTLTKWILELEHLIGFQLFTRTTQFVEPTDACRQLIEEAKLCVFHAERAMHVARVAEQGARAVLHVGRSQYIDPYLVTVINSISLPLYPSLEVSLSSMPSSELEAEVLLGKLDLALAIGDFDNPKITQLELMRTPFYVTMHEHHPLASFREVEIRQLNDLRWVLFERHVHPPLYDSIMRAAQKDEAHARSVHHVITAEEAAQEMYAGLADIALLTRAGAWKIARNGLTMRPLSHSHLHLSSKLIARADDSSRIISEFARTLKHKLNAHKRPQMDLPLKARKHS